MSRGDSTRAALVGAARELFAERGYAVVGTEEIVGRAGSPGALYHHFADKRDLFRAVYEQVEAELVASIGERMSGIEDPWELFVTGLRAFLDACTDRALIRIALLDAPVVLGWDEWREIDARYGLGLVTFASRTAWSAASSPARGAAARSPADRRDGRGGHADRQRADHEAARREVEPPLLALLAGLRQ